MHYVWNDGVVNCEIQRNRIDKCGIDGEIQINLTLTGLYVV